jgi:uncharacterized protein YndB with AHSA1/START domain
MTEEKTRFTIDRDNLLVKVEREFDAPLDLVWQAWTESELLDQWWGPQPFKAVTKIMDFTVGGQWLYAMVGPDGAVKGWNVKRFSRIDPRKSFGYRSLFCDENGDVKPETTGSDWDISFAERGGVTVVTSDIRVDSLAHLEAQVKMGFKEGYTVGLNQLDALLARLAGKGNA